MADGLKLVGRGTPMHPAEKAADLDAGKAARPVGEGSLRIVIPTVFPEGDCGFLNDVSRIGAVRHKHQHTTQNLRLVGQEKAHEALVSVEWGLVAVVFGVIVAWRQGGGQEGCGGGAATRPNLPTPNRDLPDTQL